MNMTAGKHIAALLLCVLTIWCPARTSAQGTIFFANRVRVDDVFVVDAPVFDEACQAPVSGPLFQARLYARPAGSSQAFEPVGASAPFLTGVGAGFWLPGGTRTYDGVSPGEQAEVQVRIWNTTFGATWEDAFNSGRGYGVMPPLTLATGGSGIPPGPPTFMIGLQPTCIIPEPRSGVISGLFLAVFWRFCRNRRASAACHHSRARKKRC